MNYELKYAEKAILKSIAVLILYLIFLIINMYFFSIKLHDENEVHNIILNYICYPIFNEYNFSESLLYLFNNLYFVLLFTIYYVYEYLQMHDNISSRYKSKKWIRDKYIIGILLVVIISLIQYNCIFFIFKSSMPKSLNYYFYPIIFKIFIMSSLYTLFNLFNTNKVIFCLNVIVIIVMLLYFNIYVYLILIVFSFILNYNLFDLKLFRYIL